MAADPLTVPAGIPGSALSGPWPVGAYAARLRDELRKRARLQLFGEVFGPAGQHARSAVGVAELPLGAVVEVEVIAEVS